MTIPTHQHPPPPAQNIPHTPPPANKNCQHTPSYPKYTSTHPQPPIKMFTHPHPLKIYFQPQYYGRIVFKFESQYLIFIAYPIVLRKDYQFQGKTVYKKHSNKLGTIFCLFPYSLVFTIREEASFSNGLKQFLQAYL